ncbi:MAG TPA: SMC-Scp complex subunit ScpB [Candidatus Limnocylindria bacterium]|nr:SMC-Scp complex subunit ScpB [Candidatus Limnocylindria bacterium]
MGLERIAGCIESILFVSGEAMETAALAQGLGATELETEAALDLLAAQYSVEGRGLTLKRFEGFVQLATKPEYSDIIGRALQPPRKQSLSQSALETLAVVAWKQPVTRQEVEAVRGVKCDWSLQALTQKGLIREAGRRETLGRPILYETTPQFLSHFGFSSLQDLPPLPELPESAEGEARPIP